MSLIGLPSHVSKLAIPLDALAKGVVGPTGQRLVYFETSREGVTDREGEDIAADALWDSRELFLRQGNLDLNHWSWLGNPPGSGMRPEYVIGQPLDVAREGGSIFVLGEIAQKAPPPPAEAVPGMPAGSSWADWFWHTVSVQNPPMRWFPSVFGNIAPHATVEVELRDGRSVRLIKGPLEWFSVGFAQRAQHPELPAVSTTPLGAFAMSADRPTLVPGVPEVAVLPYAAFAKAVQGAQAVMAGYGLEGKAGLSGVGAVRRESLEGRYERHKRRVLGKLLRREIDGSLEGVADAFMKCGFSKGEARHCAIRLGQELDTLVNSRRRGGVDL
ncbi:hypothetical protein [Calidithermus chliarophilus]|uniref:hypothetical protein n=1 Tax=Calidithermus chliarophilus TaxID=52023 RepID=UPI0012F68B14|nr:hypothetical protein [Calidithermus chliarophilus]